MQVADNKRLALFCVITYLRFLCFAVAFRFGILQKMLYLCTSFRKKACSTAHAGLRTMAKVRAAAVADPNRPTAKILNYGRQYHFAGIARN